MSESEDAVVEALDELRDGLTAPKPAPEFAHIQDLDVNLRTREIYVSGEIEEEFGDWFTCTLRYLEVQSHDPVTVHLNTPGGDVTSMFAFHDMVRASPCEIVTIGEGQVCSAGVLMLACGHRRLVFESCILMSHRATETIHGNLEEMESQIEVARWSEKHWATLMDRYTPEEVDGKLRDEKYWFNLGKKTAQWWITGADKIIYEGIADAMYEHKHLPVPARPAAAR